MRVRNRFTGQTLEATKTPINGAWIVRQGTVELHRGNETTAQAFLVNLADRQDYIWEVI